VLQSRKIWNKIKKKGTRTGFLALSKTEQLELFLASKEFKKLKWDIKTANDYFLLGMIYMLAEKNFEKALRRYVEEHMKEHHHGHDHDHGDLFEMHI
jgi:hypothetical protein